MYVVFWCLLFGLWWVCVFIFVIVIVVVLYGLFWYVFLWLSLIIVFGEVDVE